MADTKKGTNKDTVAVDTTNNDRADKVEIAAKLAAKSVADNKVDAAETRDDNQKRMTELNTTCENLQKQFDEIHSYIQSSDSIISDLEDRLLRQREAKQIFIARSLLIEDEYNKVVDEINSITSSSSNA